MAAPADGAPLTAGGAPAFRALLLGGSPRFLRDAFGPTLVFYAGFKLHGLIAGVAAASAWTAAVYVFERRRGRRGLAARIGLAVALVQAVAALASGSPLGYLAPPIVANALHGLAFLISVAVGHPLAAIFAVECYPVPDRVRTSAAFRRTFARISLVWGTYLLIRSAARLAILLSFSVDVYVLVNVLTAAPMTVTMLTWSFWYASRTLRQALQASAAR